MKLYHRTAQRRANQILDKGFFNATSSPESDSAANVLVRDTKRALSSDPAGDDCLLEIETDLSEDDLDSYEETEGVHGYTEWRIPAAILDEHSRVRLFADG